MRHQQSESDLPLCALGLERATVAIAHSSQRWAVWSALGSAPLYKLTSAKLGEWRLQREALWSRREEEANRQQVACAE